MDRLEIVLPRKISVNTVDSILDPIIGVDMKCKGEEVLFNFKEVEFIEPTGVTVLTNLFEWLKKQNVKTFFIRNRKENSSKYNREAMEYLEDSGFFKMYGFPEYSDGGGYIRETMLPLKKIEYKNYIQWNETEFVNWLQMQTCRHSPFTHVQVAVQEIFNNISNHSKVDTGCVFAQYYPKLKKINISFSDFGIGIPNSVRLLNKNLSDEELLEYAVKEGVSTQSVPGNRGAGLWNIVRNLTNENIGTVHIRSNFGKIWYNNKEVSAKRSSKTYYPGTFFEIQLDITNLNLYDDEEEEAFEW